MVFIENTYKQLMNIDPKDIFDIINKVRENPNVVINQIKQQLKRFQSNSVFRNKRDVKIRTFSGKAGWQQAILSIQRQKSKANLSWNSLLAKAVQEFKQAVTQDESVNPFQVIKAFCSYQGNISFNINESDTEQDLVELAAAMIVGDGDEKKGSRTAIFHPLYKQFACAVRKSGNKNVIYTVYAQSVSEPTGNSSPQKKQMSKPQSQSRSSWENQPTGKFQQPVDQSKSVVSGSNSNKYKNVEQNLNTKQAYMKKGKQFIAELNKIRKQPKQYVHALKAQIQKFKDEKTLAADYGTVTTKQGQAPYYDLISQLESQYALPTIKQVTGLTVVALEQIAETESMIQNKVPIEAILDKFCVNSQGVRSIKLKDVDGMPIAAMLMRLLVGDGDRKRTGRRKMLSPICKAIGCAISKDILVVNVGQTAKDNPLAVEEYVSNMNEPSSNKKGSRRQQQYFDSNSQFDKVSSVSKGSRMGQGERIVIKKTSKSHNESKAGRIYKITEIETIYNDGQIERQVQEQLLN